MEFFNESAVINNPAYSGNTLAMVNDACQAPAIWLLIVRERNSVSLKIPELPEE